MSEILRRKVDTSLKREVVSIEDFVRLMNGAAIISSDNRIPHSIELTHELESNGCVYEARTVYPLRRYIN